MTPELQKEFATLSEIANRHLKDVPVSGSFRHVFSIRVLPSFKPSLRWSVYSPRRPESGHRSFAALTVWRSDLDVDKFRLPLERLKHGKDITPTIEDYSVELPDSVVRKYRERLQAVPIPFFLDEPRTVGCDGTSYEFTYGGFLFGGSLRWWEHGPSQWQSFTKTVVEIVSELEGQTR